MEIFPEGFPIKVGKVSQMFLHVKFGKVYRMGVFPHGKYFNGFPKRKLTNSFFFYKWADDVRIVLAVQLSH